MPTLKNALPKYRKHRARGTSSGEITVKEMTGVFVGFSAS
jgi:hypothetical protein